MKFKDIKYLILSDVFRYGDKSRSLIFRNVFLGRNSSQRFTFWLRCCKSNNRFIRTFAKIQRVRLTRKYGVQIPETCTIGPGLELPHCLPIVVHYNVKIGKNCTLHQFVTIDGDGRGKTPVIGDSCFIGSGAVIVGDIKIGNNATVGANAVVTKDVPDNATVGGVPAKILHYNHPGMFIKNIV